MGLVSIIDQLKGINVEGLTDQQRADLRRNLRERRKNLKEALAAVDRALGALARRPKRKKATKRKTAKRAAKRR